MFRVGHWTPECPLQNALGTERLNSVCGAVPIEWRLQTATPSPGFSDHCRRPVMTFRYHLGQVTTFNAHFECPGQIYTWLCEKETAPGRTVHMRSGGRCGACSTHLNGAGPASQLGKIDVLSYHTIFGRTINLDACRVIFPEDEVVN